MKHGPARRFARNWPLSVAARFANLNCYETRLAPASAPETER